ncbi:BatD family protein [Bacteroidales bacterium OttesenSCG-928-E04]|nr:BatD family protein [Bacteroidales bacterium OttesenSCG-928-E04]
MLNRWIRLLLFFSPLAFLFQDAQAQVTCHASAPTRVESGRNFEYKITLSEKPQAIQSTNFPDFKLVGGPSQGVSHSMSIVNGRTQQQSSYTYTYVLRGEKTGTFTIPAAVFKVDGKEVKSNNVTITVIAPSQQTQQQQQRGSSAPTIGKDDVFLKASLSKSNPYEGEQVVISYKLYVLGSLDGGFSATNTNLPSQNGLWTYQLGDQSTELKGVSEVINGRQYKVYELKKVAAFPQKSGEITISPLETELYLRVYYQPARGFPRAQDFKLELKSNVLKLNAKPLPSQGRPDDFSGLVGNFQIKSNLSRTELMTNDATNLTVSINGTGNIQHVTLPEINFPPDCDVTDPRISDNINTKGNIVSGARHFEYIIIPRSSGDFKIPASKFSYFDPASGNYKTISTSEYLLKVEKGEGENSSTVNYANQKEIKYLDKDIRYIKSGKNAFLPIKDTFLFSSWYFLLLLSPLALFIAILLIWKKYREDRKDMIALKDKKANKEAKKRLRKAHSLLKEEDKDAFFVEISAALWGYMSDKYRIPRSQLSMEAVVAKLREKNLSEEYIRSAVTTLEQCEFARFAPGDASELMRGMYDQALQFMSNVEKK